MRDLVKRRPFKFGFSSTCRGMPFEHIESGTYGCVVRKALSNVTNDGHGSEKRTEFPDNVSKIFFTRRKSEGNLLHPSTYYAGKAVAKNEELQTLGFPKSIHTYTRKFQGTNANIQEIANLTHVRNGTKNPCRIDSANTNIGIIHTPYLGIDLYKVYEEFMSRHDSKLVADIRKIPLLDLLTKGVKPIFEKISIFRKNKVVHRDIKPENMMINASTGSMDIIDYDIFETDESIRSFFVQEVLFNMYPPEVILWQPALYTDPEKKIRPSYDKWYVQIGQLDDILSAYEKRYKNDMDYRYMVNLLILRNIKEDLTLLSTYSRTCLFKDGFAMTYGELMAKIEGMMMKTAETLDSYCAARSLLVLFCIYMDDSNWSTYNKELFQLIVYILVPMFNFSVEKRMLIGTAISRLNKLIGLMTSPEKSVSPSSKRARIGSASGGASRKKLKSRRRTRRMRGPK